MFHTRQTLQKWEKMNFNFFFFKMAGVVLENLASLLLHLQFSSFNCNKYSRPGDGNYSSLNSDADPTSCLSLYSFYFCISFEYIYLILYIYIHHPSGLSHRPGGHTGESHSYTQLFAKLFCFYIFDSV